jgi:hypothetical protein
MARQLAADAGQLQPPGAQPLTDQMAVLMATRYLVALRQMAGKNPDDESSFKGMRELCHDLVALRRGDHSAARLKMEQERLELELQKYQDTVAKVREQIQKFRDPKQSLNDEDRKAIVEKVDEILGLK